MMLFGEVALRPANKRCYSNAHKKGVELVTAAVIPRCRPTRGERCWLRDGGEGGRERERNLPL